MIERLCSGWKENQIMTITMYHGTRAAYLPAIGEQGLLPQAKPGNDANWKEARKWSDEERNRSVYVSPRAAIASLFAERLATEANDEGVILQIELPDEERSRLHIDEAGADPKGDADNSGMRVNDFQRFDGPIKREWIKAVAFQILIQFRRFAIAPTHRMADGGEKAKGDPTHR
ncbi:hypothetical protein LGH82_33150 [Mesorhizobium sp. PAMC28654]|uniref:hypothetical protein n=1 Tax=Mesorhizobium sp. PAMC28654 TaxID=2880934 RepID=UPI001D09C4E2|nr:hypothetical protein [Mesorhizobium sp. PAMC28654]UDL89829.1 hypothetical protein LGH82_33150 [Mesorhizobium sp. PAMC28654]